MTFRIFLTALALTTPALPAAAQPTAARPALTPADEAAAFRTAGFKRVGRQWRGCDDPGTASYEPGRIDTARDIDGDGRPDAVIVEGSTFCFGMTGMGYALVSKQADGTWKRINGGQGIPRFLPRRAAAGWPDLQIGGPGFCFPVERWNGRAYALHRHEYQGKPCRP